MATIRVKDKITGQVGSMPSEKFDPNEFDLLDSPKQVTSSNRSGGDSLLSSLGKAGLGLLSNIVKPGVDYGKLLGAGLVQAPVLAATKGRVNIPFMNEQELTKAGSGNIEKALPYALKKSAGAASYAIPFGKGAGLLQKAILPGAASGALFETSSDEATPESVLGAGITGGITSGLLHKILGGAGGKLKGAGEKLEAGVINPKVPVGPKMIGAEKSISEASRTFGLKGTPTQRLTQVGQLYNQFSDDLGKVVSTSQKTASGKTIKNILNKSLDEAGFTDKAYKSVRTALTSRIKEGNIKPQEILDLKMSVGKQFKKALERGAQNPREEIGVAMWESLDDALTKIEPGAKAITSKMSQLYKLSPGLAEARKATVQVPILGNRVSAEGLQSGAESVGRGLQKTGTALDSILSPLQNPLGQKAATLGAVSAASGRGQDLNPVEQELYKKYNIDGQGVQGAMSEVEGATVPSEEETAPEQFISKDQLLQVILSPGITDKTKKNIMAAYKLQDEGTKKTKLSAQEQTALDQAESGLNLIDTLSGQYGKVQKAGLTAKTPGLGLLQGILGSAGSISQSAPEAAVYERSKKAFLSKLARATGEKGVLTDQDIKRIESILPSFYDTPEVAEGNLALIRQIVGDAIMAKRKGGAQTENTGLEDAMSLLE